MLSAFVKKYILLRNILFGKSKKKTLKFWFHPRFTFIDFLKNKGCLSEDTKHPEISTVKHSGLQISETFDHLSIFWFWWTLSCPDRFYRVRRSRSSGPCWNEAVTDRLWPWFFLSACICDGKVALHMEMKFYQQGQNIKCINCVVINPEKELWFVHSKRKKSLQFFFSS